MDPGEEIKEQQPPITQDNIESTNNAGLPNEASNISLEACKKFVTALKEFKSKAATVGSNKAIIEMFNSLPSVAMENENSSYTSYVPVDLDVLVFMMLDMNCWALSLSHIVHLVSSNVPPSIFQQLSNSDTSIKEILMINADLQLPTPLVQKRSFNFYRFLMEIDETTRVVFDISTEYFLHKSDGSLGLNVWRRRSGVIFQPSDNGSKVLWVENVQAPARQLQANMYSGLMDSKKGFSARRWLSTLMWWFDRSHSRFTNNKMSVTAENLLLKLTEKMKMVFLDIVNATPEDRNWVTLSNESVRVMRSRIETFSIPGTYSCIAVTTFKLGVTPTEAFKFLSGHLVEIQWPLSLESCKGREEMLKFHSDSNFITLLKRGIYEHVYAENPKHHEYLLQETSSDGLCSFIVAAPLTERDVYSSLFFGIERDVMLCPAGFAILPDGLSSETSLVTIAVRQPQYISNTEDAFISSMETAIGCMIQDIENESKLLSSLAFNLNLLTQKILSQH